MHAFGLARRGHEVTVACPPNPERRHADYPPNLKVVEFNISGSSDFREGFQGDVAKYADFVATFQCDAIILHCWHTWSLDVAFPVLNRNSAKKILVSHGYTKHMAEIHSRFPWGLGAWIGWQPYVWSFASQVKKLDTIVFLSERRDWLRFFDRKLVDFLGYPKTAVIPNGASIRLSSETLPDFRKQFSIAPDELLLLNVANFCDRKNQISTLRSFAEAELENATLVFIGSEVSNNYAERLLEVHRELKARHPRLRVQILDHIPREQIFAAYHAADLFVLSAKVETQPLALIDAMACGVPFISTASGCIREMPGGVAIESEREMAGAMRKLAGNPELRRNLAQSGAEAVDRIYNWEKILDCYERLLGELTTTPAARKM